VVHNDWSDSKTTQLKDRHSGKVDILEISRRVTFKEKLLEDSGQKQGNSIVDKIVGKPNYDHSEGDRYVFCAE